MEKNVKRKAGRISFSQELFKELAENESAIENICTLTLNDFLVDEFRAIAWLVHLQIIPFNPIEWIPTLHAHKANYEQNYNKWITEDIANYINSSKNCEESILPNKIKDLLNLLKLDIDRTFQELDLFRNKRNKEFLIKLLFIWNQENEEVGYKQGINEILATVFYSLYPSGIYYHCQQISSELVEIKDIFKEMNHEDNIELFTYLVFNLLMNNCFKNLYNYNTTKKIQTKILASCKTLTQLRNSTASELHFRISRIFYVYLRLVEEKLFLHLYFMDIDPYLIMFRWILCGLNREVEIETAIYFWDCIFCLENKNLLETKISITSEQNFHFLDFICLAMIVEIKSQLLEEEDYCFLLQTLMKYPIPINPKSIISLALKLREKVITALSGQTDDTQLFN